MTDLEKQQLTQLQVDGLMQKLNELLMGYQMRVIMPALLGSMRNCYELLKADKDENTFWFYLNQSFNLGWFGPPRNIETKNKVVLTDVNKNKRAKDGSAKNYTGGANDSSDNN